MTVIWKSMAGLRMHMTPKKLPSVTHAVFVWGEVCVSAIEPRWEPSPVA